MSLLVVVPSRGRPENIRALAEAWTQTVVGDAVLVVAVDEDDPELDRYLEVGPCQVGPPSAGMVEPLNRVATTYMAKWPRTFHCVGFLGDDHRPRTVGWDVRVADALDQLGTGIVYGNDLLQGERLPTAAFMTGDIVRTLGWMAPPTLRHLFVDDAWLALGRGLDAISYLPDVIIEHLHPVAGKAANDDGYERVNAPAMWQHDRAAFEAWIRDGGLDAAVATVKEAACVGR